MKRARAGKVFVAIVALALAGCASISEYNPFVSMSDYRSVAIESFEGPGSSGGVFAERLGRAFADAGIDRRVAGLAYSGKALLVKGSVVVYDRGNAAERLRFGRNIGNARFAAQVIVVDLETGDPIASVLVRESYDGALDGRRIVHQDVEALAERAARRFVEELLGELP